MASSRPCAACSGQTSPSFVRWVTSSWVGRRDWASPRQGGCVILLTIGGLYGSATVKGEFGGRLALPFGTRGEASPACEENLCAGAGRIQQWADRSPGWVAGRQAS